MSCDCPRTEKVIANERQELGFSRREVSFNSDGVLVPVYDIVNINCKKCGESYVLERFSGKYLSLVSEGFVSEE